MDQIGVTILLRLKQTLSRSMPSQADLLQAHEKGPGL